MKRQTRVCVALSLLLGVVAAPSFAGTIVVPSCSDIDVQTAINAARSGDTVRIPAGRCTWTTRVSIPNTKAITLQGAGIGVTVIVDHTPEGFRGAAILLNAPTSGGTTRITGMSFDSDLIDKKNGGSVINVIGGGINSFRIDHIHIYNLRTRGINWNHTGLVVSGVIDHVTFECPGDYSCHATDGEGDSTGDSTQFTRGMTLGENKAVFIEDCIYNYTYNNDGLLDTYNGAKFVFRFNTATMGNLGHHGADSGGHRGIHSFEAYGNTFTRSGANQKSFMFRSGTGVMFDNTFIGPWVGEKLSVYRVNEPYPPWGQCDGTNPFDGNLGSGSNAGWPCLDQTGWFFSTTGVSGATPSGNTAVSVPLYLWNNLKNGSLLPDPTGNFAPEDPYFAGNRDFYNQGATFDGTSGVGRGTKSAMLALGCTRGVAFWVTDEGEWNNAHAGVDGQLYKCSATNTWTLYYTPYTYPHPLQSATPAPPFNVTIK